jgi:hypothetical protein
LQLAAPENPQLAVDSCISVEGLPMAIQDERLKDLVQLGQSHLDSARVLCGEGDYIPVYFSCFQAVVKILQAVNAQNAGDTYSEMFFRMEDLYGLITSAEFTVDSPLNRKPFCGAFTNPRPQFTRQFG